ncbi:MAG: TIGR03364 family FAD-dependent oxidoreductase [Hyphomonas sp.]
MKHDYDVAVIGAGIVGIAHALAAARTGARVALIEARGRAVGASIRNFGFVTVTGQERQEMWPLARRTRDIWETVAPAAGIRIEQTGLMMIARRPEAAAVLEVFLQTEMGEGCVLAGQEELERRAPGVPFTDMDCALLSPHEFRIEAKAALPLLLKWLASEWRVDIHTSTLAIQTLPGCVLTSRGDVRASTIFVCPGDEVSGLMPSLAEEMAVRPCKLNMMRLAAPDYRLPSPVMSDLGLVRYEGYSALPEINALKERLTREQSSQLAAGIHLIAVQSGDGSLIVGDSHDYSDTPDPFQRDSIDRLILDEFACVLGAPPPVIERWVGTYAWSPDRNWFSRETQPGVHATVITCGAGMSTAFAIAEDVVAGALQSSSRSAV